MKSWNQIVSLVLMYLVFFLHVLYWKLFHLYLYLTPYHTGVYVLQKINFFPGCKKNIFTLLPFLVFSPRMDWSLMLDWPSLTHNKINMLKKSENILCPLVLKQQDDVLDEYNWIKLYYLDNWVSHQTNSRAPSRQELIRIIFKIYVILKEYLPILIVSIEDNVR